jgi:hypothetical protein
MILGLLKLMCRFPFTGYQTDFEVPLETYFTTGAIHPQRKYNVHKSTPAPLF